MQAQLMTEEIEIHPCVGAASFLGSHDAGIEFPRRIEIVNMNRKMEYRTHGLSFPGLGPPVVPRCPVVMRCGLSY